MVDDPGSILCHYDIVFAKAKAALEALASGAIVIPCDKFGMGEMVNSENYAHYRKFNFGMRILNRPVKSDLVLKEIRKYNPGDSKILAESIRADTDFKKYVDIITGYNTDAIHRNKEGFQTYHKPVAFNPLLYWVRRKWISRKREWQKQIHRLNRWWRYG